MTTSQPTPSQGQPLPAVLTDFDDTAAVQNVAEMLLEQFGDPAWKQVRQRFRGGEISLMEYQEIAFRQIRADRITMQEYVKASACLRPHFGALWEHCQAQGIPLAVVSQGLDFYIQALLDKEGFPQVPVYSVNTRFTSQGITYQYRHAHPGQERLGNSKGLVVDSYRRRGRYVIYIGDGRSDFEAAERADMVFAHKVLAEECTRKQIPFRPFGDFGDVLAAVKEFAPQNAGASAKPWRRAARLRPRESRAFAAYHEEGAP
ncbi:MAG: HAD-IB family phosphatase [SAR202 cluster bacterium]|nr:HAD-IB family phosphatase [SAR202 cluster bacterium]